MQNESKRNNNPSKSFKKVNKQINKLTKRVKRIRIRKQKGNRKSAHGFGAKGITGNGNKFHSNDQFYRPTDLIKRDPAETLLAMRRYARMSKDTYLLALAHPDLAVANQIPVKLFSDMPIPSASIGYRDQYQLATSSQGTFLLSWRPSFLASSGYLGTTFTASSKITFNNSSTLTGSTGVAGNVFLSGEYVPNVGIQRYRLVSAMLRISYNGPVLNQSGTMTSCATFDPFGICMGTSTTPVTSQSDTLVDRFGNFANIRNGLWNTSISVTTHASGVECLYVPTDPLCYVFERDGNYQGGYSATTPIVVRGSGEGAPICYVIAGQNLPVSATCLFLEVFYNFEVIADPSSAPILRANTSNVLNASEARQVKEHISDSVASNGLIRPSRTSDFSSVLDTIAQFGMKYIPMALAALS